MSSSDSEAMGTVGTELKKLRKRWPNCQKVIQNSIKRRGAKQNKPLEVVAFEMMLESKPHVSLLMEHRRLVLKGVSPLLLGDGGVEEAFDNLFALMKKGKQPQRSLSAHLASIPMLMEYSYKLASKLEVNISYSSVKVVNDVLRLYYGVRCVVSHGVAKKTVDKGCLSNFPQLLKNLRLICIRLWFVGMCNASHPTTNLKLLHNWPSLEQWLIPLLYTM